VFENVQSGAVPPMTGYEYSINLPAAVAVAVEVILYLEGVTVTAEPV
jgi:hypothetical protein